MAHSHRYLLSTPLLVLPLAALLFPATPSASLPVAHPESVVEPGLPAPTSSLSEKVAGMQPSLTEGLVPPTPSTGIERSTQGLARRVSAALTGTPEIRSGANQAPVGDPARATRPEVETGEPPLVGAQADWICGRWVELWQGSGRGRDCEWVPRRWSRIRSADRSEAGLAASDTAD